MRLHKLFVLWIVLFLNVSIGLASEKITTHDIGAVAKKVEQLVKKYGSDNVIVGFDLDNTLLATKQPIGSDQWFTWQEELLKKHPSHPALVSKSFGGLLHAWGELLSYSSMVTPHPNTANVIKQIQGMGSAQSRVKVFALTSRGHEYKYSTIRELKKNGILLKHSAIGPKEGLPSLWKSYDRKTVAKDYNFSAPEVSEFKLSRSPRDVTYVDGIFFTAGLHKGAMLRILLQKSNVTPKALVFVDDKAKHTNGIQKAYLKSGIDVVTFRYGVEDPKVESFNTGSKQQVAAQWEKLQTVFESGKKDLIKKTLAHIFVE